MTSNFEGIQTMPTLKNYRLFISHAWQHGGDYDRLVNMLNEVSYFNWHNHSVPQHDPLDANNTQALKKALRNQMKSTNCVLIISGMYATYRKWIQYEIDLAVEWNKPIVGVKPRGSERIPYAVSSVAKEMVGWSTSSIVNAIRRHALRVRRS